ncbi:hypothetical protein BAUCODRAFT_288739 [Baudoinia panamericana UAMH 10762]|uniref:Amidase domain-containing protein n=1 Tax=Baudoinia panamericana (strain UAMH 10762) TaxID=717646 RepID=M2M7X2_BAUPA|nr:uncharacterized protein BAUCODRAFT_288739 [Baudoinia panamericana UAMH 10762]EMC92431.1 hypothetical protein BAUCODRAFT_288739 [Baudoinia panamericana UAMH 10762]
MSSTDLQPWQLRTKEYREQAAAKIPKEWILKPEYTADGGPTSSRFVLDVPAKCGILSERELDITENYDAVALLEKLASGHFTSVEITTAFCKRAAIAQQLTCCLTETFFGQALERAKYCDEYLASHKTPIGPLHGLPVSLKDSFNVKGINSTIGYVSFIGHGPAQDDAALVKVLLSLGAVLYVKTNVPQSLMTGDSENNVFLRVLNPNKLCLGAGGSSGGEGALLRMKGSPIGVGTDIAGSIRIPAYVNGTFGLKPTSRRVPYGGQKGSGRPGFFGILPAAGPLARSVRDISAFMAAVLGYDCWTVDEGVISVPWRRLPSPQGKLTLGYLLEDDMFPLHPTVLRTVKTATAKLTEAGHTVIPVAEHLPPKILEEVVDSAWYNFGMDPARTSEGHVNASGEPFVASIATATPPALKHFKPTLDDAYRFHVERQAFCAKFRELFVEQKLDAIILPAYQATAVAHDKYGVPMYTVLANMLDHPSIVMPYLKADKKLDAEYRRDVSYLPAYVPDEVEGAPCGLQLVGRPMKDEELVEHSQIVADALGIKPL